MVPDLVPPLWIFLTVRLTWNEAMSSFVLRIDTAKLWTFMSPKHLRTISVGHLLGVWKWCVLQLLAELVFDFRMGRLHNLDGKKNVCHWIKLGLHGMSRYAQSYHIKAPFQPVSLVCMEQLNTFWRSLLLFPLSKQGTSPCFGSYISLFWIQCKTHGGVAWNIYVMPILWWRHASYCRSILHSLDRKSVV